MARKKKTPIVEQVQPYIEGVAKSLVDRIYGSQGLPWGTRLTELEDVVLAVREALSEEMLAQALQRQAQSTASHPPACCPSCGGATASQPEREPRNVQTRAGEAEWEEPNEYCRRCRRSFFPAEPKFGN